MKNTSNLKLRKILNDLKRRPEDAAKDLGVSVNKINGLETFLTIVKPMKKTKKSLYRYGRLHNSFGENSSDSIYENISA